MTKMSEYGSTYLETREFPVAKKSRVHVFVNIAVNPILFKLG